MVTIRWLLVFLLLPGCVHTIEVVSNPSGAYVEYGPRASGEEQRAQVVETPGVIRVAAVPFARRPFTVSMPGYRTFEGDLRWAGVETFVEVPKVLGLQRIRRLEIQLLREHGPVGTWDPAHVGQ